LLGLFFIDQSRFFWFNSDINYIYMPYLIDSNKIGRSMLKIIGVLILVLAIIGIALYLI